jgi:hypothetical protein
MKPFNTNRLPKRLIIKNLRLIAPPILVAVLSLGKTNVFAWGSDGHQTIGAIADKLLAGTDAIKTVMRRKQAKTPQELADALLAEGPRPTVLRGPLDKNVVAWANESLEAATLAFDDIGYSTYRDDLPDSRTGTTSGWAVTLPQAYVQTASDIAKERFLLAGKRLAALLKAALK